MNRPLSHYQSHEIIKKKYKERHNRAANAEKARSIAIHVEQGVNFIESAAQAPVTIQPLALFYGVAALTRGLTLFLNDSASESSLTGSHGLEIQDWSVLGSTKPARGIDQLQLRVTRGLFTDFQSATNGRARFHANSSRANWGILLDLIPTGTEVSFIDVLGLLPDAWSEYEAWTNRAQQRYSLQGIRSIQESGATKQEFIISTTAGGNALNSLFPNEAIATTQSGNTYTIITNENPHIQPVQLHKGAFDIGDVLFVPPIHAGSALSPITTYYTVAFTMSMLARYRLSDWLAIWRGEKGDSARPLFEQTMVLIQTEFPQLCADILDDGNM